MCEAKRCVRHPLQAREKEHRKLFGAIRVLKTLLGDLKSPVISLGPTGNSESCLKMSLIWTESGAEEREHLYMQPN